jgi:carbonic anhydrase/acetyltransferase-like protein (isoleucine patch superfamily)
MQGLQQTFGAAMRTLGRKLESAGRTMQDGLGAVEKVVPSTRVVSFKGKGFTYGMQAQVASTASVIGDIKFGEMSSAWNGATLKGDKNSIVVGKNSAVLDNAVVTSTAEHKTEIGDDVTISPGAKVHGASVGSGSMIGMNAVVMPGSSVGKDCYVDGGAVVPSGTSIPDGQLWTGSPARYLRNLSLDEMAFLRSTAITNGELALENGSQEGLSGEEAEKQEELHFLRLRRQQTAELGVSEYDPYTVYYQEEQQRDEDVIEYYRLAAKRDSHDLFREESHNDAELLEAREAMQVERDAAQDAKYEAMAQDARVATALRRLSAVPSKRAAAREAVLAHLAGIDEEAAARVSGFIAKAGAASGEEADAALLAELKALDGRPQVTHVLAEELAALKAHAAACSAKLEQ